MRIVVEVPDTTLCVFMNYVYSTGSGLEMSCKSIQTDDLEKIKVKKRG